MAGDATLVLEISTTAANGLPENLDAGQARAALALMAQLHLCYEVRQLAQCVAEHLAGLIQADSWRLNFTPAAVRAAFNQETPSVETTESGESDAWPGLSTAPWTNAPRGGAWPLIQTAVQRRQAPEGCALSVSLVVYGQTLGTLEGWRAGAAAQPFERQEEDLLTTLAPFIAHALARAQRLGELEQLSYTDELTRLYNERYLRQRLVEEVKRARRNGSHLALLFFDLDDFKLINDAHGHLVGSHVLAECGAVISSVVRETDIVARYGGDEFVVILPETHLEQAELVTERIRAKLAAHTFHGGRELRLEVRASFGVAAHPDHARTPQELIANADAAMYAAKAAGKNCVRYAPEK